MGVSFVQLLILCPLIFLSGFVDSIAGGGGLISLPAYMIIGLPAHTARGTNKLTAFMGTTVSTTRYAMKGFIPWKKALPCVICALGGSALGTKLGLLVDENIFKIVMLIVIPATAIYLWFFKKDLEEKEPLSDKKTVIYACIISFVLGIYDGFYGPGTGTFLIILLSAAAHLSINESNGIAKAINLATNVASLVVFILNGKVMFLLGATAGVFSIAGNYLGTKMFFKNGQKIVRPIMMIVLLIFFVKILMELFGIA